MHQVPEIQASLQRKLFLNSFEQSKLVKDLNY